MRILSASFKQAFTNSKAIGFTVSSGIIIKDGKLTYTFVSIGTMKLVDGIGDDMVEKVYKYTITAHDKDAKKYTLTMSSDFENYIAEVDYSNEDEYKISMRIV